MTNKQSLNGVRSAAIEAHPATAARPLRALAMQEMYGEDADKALAQLRQLWADRHGLKLDIRHTAELPPYRQDDLYWDLLVWQTTARPADAAPQERRRDAAKLERRTRWLAQWANEWPGRLVVIDDPETFDKVRAIGRTRHEVRLENVIAGDDEPPGGWLAAKRREARDTVWIVVDITGSVPTNTGWFDTRNECAAHIAEHMDSAETREYGLDSMYEPSRIELKPGAHEGGCIWLRIRPPHHELDQDEKAYPSRDACAAAAGGDGLTPTPIERHPAQAAA